MFRNICSGSRFCSCNDENVYLGRQNVLGDWSCCGLSSPHPHLSYSLCALYLPVHGHHEMRSLCLSVSDVCFHKVRWQKADSQSANQLAFQLLLILILDVVIVKMSNQIDQLTNRTTQHLCNLCGPIVSFLLYVHLCLIGNLFFVVDLDLQHINIFFYFLSKNNTLIISNQ